MVQVKACESLLGGELLQMMETSAVALMMICDFLLALAEWASDPKTQVHLVIC